jgi:hypothetical protein
LLLVVVVMVASVAVAGFSFGIIGQAQNSTEVAATGTAFPAADFVANGVPTGFICGTTPTAPYLTLTNTGTTAAAVASVTITWAGANSAFAAPGGCIIGASGSSTATTYLNFAAASYLAAQGAQDAVSGQSYTGTVTLSNGAQLLFTGVWQ